MFLALLALAAAQTSDKLPPANPLPYAPDAETAAVLAPVNRLMGAIATSDAAEARASARADATVLAVVERPGGNRTVSGGTFAEFTTHLKPGTDRAEERLTDPAVEVDGDMAMVWSPYVFLMNGKLLHCGTDHFSLVREGGRWQIAAITWTQRTSGCPGS